VKTLLRKLQAAIDTVAFRVAGRSGFGSALYYVFCSEAFRRENRAVLEGRRRYEEDAHRPRQSCALLRRNIHRLEKGLLMRPLRPLFALDYIAETVDCYANVLESALLEKGVSRNELQWAHDVLKRYFAVSGSHPVVDALSKRFAELASPDANLCAPTTPYRRELHRPLPVTYEQFLELATRRRSVRWFLPKPVPRDCVDRAIQIAALSPSACNRQPFHFRIFDEPELVQKVAALPQGTEGYRENIPMIIVVLGRLRCFLDERDRHLIYIDGSLAAMSLAFGLETLGLSSCLINWPDLPSRERKMAKLLKLTPDERPIMLIAVGYPDPEGLVAASVKKTLGELRSYNVI
jgi:nitroreductase